MWFITLIVLAIAAILVIKAVKAQSSRKPVGEVDASPSSGLQGQLKRDSSSQNMAEPQTAANDSEQFNTTVADAVVETPEASTTDTVETAEASTTDTVETAGSQQDELQEIREMIKILNLAEVDSTRLKISTEQFNALRDENNASMEASSMPSREAQADIADRLRRMLA